MSISYAVFCLKKKSTLPLIQLTRLAKAANVHGVVVITAEKLYVHVEYVLEHQRAQKSSLFPYTTLFRSGTFAQSPGFERAHLTVGRVWFSRAMQPAVAS